MPDHFKTIWSEEIRLLMDDGQREALRRRLMSVYAEPLRAYYLAVAGGSGPEPDDVINGFFADRLGRDTWIESWRASGKPLRRWLMNGLLFYLKEERRRRRHAAADLAEADVPATASVDPAVILDATFARQIVKEAIVVAQESCRSDGLEAHWRAFRRRFVEGASFAQVGAEVGVDAARADVMARTATRRFRRALRQLLLDDGVEAAAVDEEIQALMLKRARS